MFRLIVLWLDSLCLRLLYWLFDSLINVVLCWLIGFAYCFVGLFVYVVLIFEWMLVVSLGLVMRYDALMVLLFAILFSLCGCLLCWF